MEFSITIAFTLKKSSSTLNDVDDKINNLEEKASGVPGFKDYEIFLDIGTSIFQERWHSIESYLTHLETVEQQYLSFLEGIVVCKLDIIGTEEAIADTTLHRIFAPFHPKFSVLKIEKKKKIL